MTKGKGKAKDQSSTPLLNRTWCKLKQFAETRIPPVTDVKYSAWLNLRDIYGKVGQMEPHYILDPTGEYPDARLRTRRWDVELFIPERTRLIMDPVPLILETETVVYWEGQYAVCQICKVTGHWTSECNSAIRAQVQKEKMSKIPPAPIATPDQPAATNPPPTQPAVEATSSTQPPASQKQPQKRCKWKLPLQKRGPRKTPHNQHPRKLLLRHQ